MKSALPYLQLLRVPNVFTAMADIFMGFLFVHHGLRPVWEFLLLLTASSCLYCAGMVLNDLFDLKVDTRLRPQRPLPSGRVSKRTAVALAVGLTTLGLLAATLCSLASGTVALLLVVAILLYDGPCKTTPLGPVMMGLCRLLNVVLGMSTVLSTAGESALPPAWQVCLAMGLYVAGVTWFARREAEQSARAQLIGAALVMNLAFGLLALAGRDSVFRYNDYYWLMLVVAAWTVDRRLLSAIQSPEPARVQAAVKTSLMSLVWLDATIVCGVESPPWAAVVLLLLVPSLILGKWVYST